MRFLPQRAKDQTADPCGDKEMKEMVDAYDRMIDKAVNTSVDRHRAGADEDVSLTETLIAVRAAQAVETLTGVNWEEHLESWADDVREAAADEAAAAAEPRTPPTAE